MALEQTVQGGAGPRSRELRLAVVCYGGVSLAVYMHGITKELHKLVLASTALEADHEHNPFPPGTTEGVYWDLLAKLAAAGDGTDGVAIRVVVDIISGTSAGGINGVYLAKALANNTSQDALRQLWLEKGDIGQLLRGWRRLPYQLRVAAMAAKVWRWGPPLRGDDMSRWLHQALDTMDRSRAVTPRAASLVPADQSLHLFVPITDFHGYDRDIPLYDPRFVKDRTHRHVMAFHHHADASQFGPAFNHLLAFAARATSSFPGAFPPVSFQEYNQAFAPVADLASNSADFFPLYALARRPVDPATTYFVDGGVLDNFPFQSAIAAIPGQSAAAEVDRRLIYIEPDPGGQEVVGASAPGGAPGWLRTIFGGYAGIPRNEPILDDLLALAERNEAVLRVRDVIEASFESIGERVEKILAESGRGGRRLDLRALSSAADLDALRRSVETKALAEAGFSASTYLRVRIRSMVDAYAGAIAGAMHFPAGSYQAAFVVSVLRRWAAEDGLLEQRPNAEQRDTQVAFLAGLDLGYQDRRIRFVIAALSWLYRNVGQPGFPTRAQLDEAKGRLYVHLGALQAIMAGLAHDPALTERLASVFAPDEMTEAASGEESSVAAFVAAHRDELVAVRTTVA
ncbi:MAG: patatin-like protein, partial [Acidimicrobiales bacterium]